MPAPALSEDDENQILEVLNETARANPGLKTSGLNGSFPTVVGLTLKSLVKAGGNINTVKSRLRNLAARRPRDWEDACRGAWVCPTPLPPGRMAVAKSGVRRWLLTAAQDETSIHQPFWRNLLAYAEHLGAEVLVGGFTYQKGLFEDHASRTAVFAEAVQPYMAHDRVCLGPVDFCAEMNILPTAVRPLSGLDTYSRGRDAVFPHAKIQLVSVPAIEHGKAAVLCTTGACTIENYIEKKAGLKAKFHHVIGATIVEVDADGDSFMRQISATDDGAFYDLDLKIDDGKVTAGHRVEALTAGDIHIEKADPDVLMGLWGYDIAERRVTRTDCLVDALRPRHQFFHDLLDFQARNHHRRHDLPFLFEMVANGTDSVEEGVRACAHFLRGTAREWCQSVVIPSNHNDAYPRWLNEVDARPDPVNAVFWLRSNLALYTAIASGARDFDVFKWACCQFDPAGLEDIVFLPRGGSYVICQAQGGIENVLHGDKGPNGARGSTLNLTKVSMRVNKGHSHVAEILDGVYSAGLCGKFQQGYNEGSPSSWSHSQIITYANAKRTIVTCRGRKWRA
jgi:hypothetical protein